MNFIPIEYNQQNVINEIDEELIKQIIDRTDYGGFNLYTCSKSFKINDIYYNLFVIRYNHNTSNMAKMIIIQVY